MEELAKAGITVGIGIAPIILSLNDSHIPGLLKRARSAGASSAFMTMLRLPGNVAPYFEQKLWERMPTKADRILNRIREARGGKLNSSEFGERMRGQSEQWRVVEQIFNLHCRRFGLNSENEGVYAPVRPSRFRRPSAQGSLFDLSGAC
jgi:DNA repair photolyase